MDAGETKASSHVPGLRQQTRVRVFMKDETCNFFFLSTYCFTTLKRPSKKFVLGMPKGQWNAHKLSHCIANNKGFTNIYFSFTLDLGEKITGDLAVAGFRV